MSERDPMQDLLREWKSPEPGPDFDSRVASAYRAEFPIGRRRQPVLRRLWAARISVPVPVLLAAMAAIALFLWLRPATAPRPANLPSGVFTQLNVNGFQPLPNGEARVVPVRRAEDKETH
jgi:hypothetical protein